MGLMDNIGKKVSSALDSAAVWTDAPKRGHIRIYRGVNPERNKLDATDPTHGTWYTTTYDDAVNYANWDYQGTGELGPKRAILAMDVPLKDAFEYAKVGSRRRVNSPKELLDSEIPIEMQLPPDIARKARLYEGDIEEARLGAYLRSLGLLAPTMGAASLYSPQNAQALQYRNMAEQQSLQEPTFDPTNLIAPGGLMGNIGGEGIGALMKYLSGQRMNTELGI
jgi:hypothetical protein